MGYESLRGSEDELAYNLLNPSYLAVGKPDLDASWVVGGVGEDILHHSPGPLPRPLVLL